MSGIMWKVMEIYYKYLYIAFIAFIKSSIGAMNRRRSYQAS